MSGTFFTEKPGSKKFFKTQNLVKSKVARKVQFLIPSFITVVSTFCGFLALLSAVKGRFEYATQCIVLSIILDGLDGRVARRLNATSAFGREFDSLSDLIAFGVAPAVLIYFWAFNTIADEFGILVSFIFIACAATRLARFNIAESSEPSKFFSGLATPGAALAVASLVYFYPQRLENYYLIGFTMVYSLVLSVLMVSTFRYFSIKRLKLSSGNPRINIFILSLLVALSWYHLRMAILVVGTGYALSGPLWYLYVTMKKK